jgi:hypothetical protein
VGQPTQSLTARLWTVKIRRLQRGDVIARSLREGAHCTSGLEKTRHVGLAAALPRNHPSAAAPGVFLANFDRRPLADKGPRTKSLGPWAPLCSVSVAATRSGWPRRKGVMSRL